MPASSSEIDNTPSTDRLVIRIKLIPPAPQPPAWRRLSPVALAILAVAAVLLTWLGIRTFTADPTPPPTATNVRSVAPTPIPAGPIPARPKPIEQEAPQPPDPPPSPVNEVIPDVPQSALDTIRGTIRVAVRVTIDNQGAVVDATAEERGPSRYFERLSLAAAKQWTFTPAKSQEPRTVLVRFNFTRFAATAEASPEQ